MAFENDPDGLRIAQAYAGVSFDKPRVVQHVALCEYEGDWTLPEFNKLIANAVATIPHNARASARVWMYDPGYDGSTSLQITYEATEHPTDVADRVRQCEDYVAERRREERATYDRLKEKFSRLNGTEAT